MNWGQGLRAMGTSDIAWGAYMRPYSFSYTPTGGTAIAAVPSDHFAIAPKDGWVKPQDLNATLTYDQRINQNMDFEISGYTYTDSAHAHNFESASWNPVSIDVNKQLPNGSSNPNYGKMYSDFLMDEQVQNHWVHEIRGQFSYHFDTTAWNVPLKQLFSVSAGQQTTEYDARQLQAMDSAADPSLSNWNSNNWALDMVWARMYWDTPQAAINPPSTIKYMALPFNWYDFDSQQTIKYYGAFSQTRLWDDRLNITLGMRRDDWHNTKHGLRGVTNAPIDAGSAGNSYSAGVIGYVTDWLGVFGNSSTNYQPAAGGLANGLFGEVFGASKGKGENAGLRLTTKDGKYYASVTYYKDTGTKWIGGDAPGFQSIWSDYFAAGGTKTDIGPSGAVSGTYPNQTAQMQYNVTYDLKYTGTELELVANPTKNIRLQVHYSKPKGEKTNDGLEGVRYYNMHVADWRVVAVGPNPKGLVLKSDLDQAEANFKIWAVPALAGGVVDEMWNAWATYSFTEDMLKGFDIGFGATHEGSRNIDGTHGTNAFTTESLMVGYSMDINALNHKLHTRFQLNVDNLFGSNTLVFQNYNGNTPMDFNYIPPRKATLTAKFEF
jgi:hypothetical protein